MREQYVADTRRIDAAGTEPQPVPVPLTGAERELWAATYADWDWVSAHPEALEPYRGQYVGVFDGRVVAHGVDANAFRASLEAAGYGGKLVLMLRVPAPSEAEGILVL